MKKLLLIIICLLGVSSCGDIGKDAEKLEVNAFALDVYPGGDEGIRVKDPSSVEPGGVIVLKQGFFEFWFTFLNLNEKSLVITDFKLELLKGGEVVTTKDYLPQRHIPDSPIRDVTDIDTDGNTTEIIGGGVGDPNQRYFAFLDPDSENTKFLGGQEEGKLWLDGLLQDEDSGEFAYSVRVIFNGFTTETTLESGDDPFLKAEGIFKRSVFFTVK